MCLYLVNTVQDVGGSHHVFSFSVQLDSRPLRHLYTMQWKLLSLALLAQHGCAQVGRMPMLRFSCSQLVVERLDPLVNPGMNPSPHVHQIVGKSLW